ncbi:hypothetical protein Pint_17607 [Pistacia integerrima]|uniref:Uncharacterized protein n=1 Tax=Pistacia integerrima TaxID=434235 RepID=A0ACC0YTH8_9ROSI|nr:hypothetical protein Pint_17607 [Pistacia integerrima]
MMMMAMSGGRFLQHLLLAVLILFLFQQRVADSDVISCREEEREALLVFKQGLLDNVGILSSWGSEDDKKNCCAWEGIQCLQTGHVYGLALNGKKTSNAPFEGWETFQGYNFLILAIMPWAPLKVNATASFVSLDLTGNNVQLLKLSEITWFL